jgi:hypothetical protein
MTIPQLGAWFHAWRTLAALGAFVCLAAAAV